MSIRVLPGRYEADGLQAGDMRDDNVLQMKLVWCPAGDFAMGSRGVGVTISRGFWMGQTEVTEGQWRRLMHSDPWKTRTPAFVVGGTHHPANPISWTEAMAFCRKLTDEESNAGRLPCGSEYKLPTEAQWEYACRAGEQRTYSFGDDVTVLCEYAWFIDNSLDDRGYRYPRQVALKAPNRWGLFDMHGNVAEWCEDYYAHEPQGGIDPFIAEGRDHVVRGGHFANESANCRSAVRVWAPAKPIVPGSGFRVALCSQILKQILNDRMSDEGDSRVGDGAAGPENGGGQTSRMGPPGER